MVTRLNKMMALLVVCVVCSLPGIAGSVVSGGAGVASGDGTGAVLSHGAGTDEVAAPEAKSRTAASAPVAAARTESRAAEEEEATPALMVASWVLVALIAARRMVF